MKPLLTLLLLLAAALVASSSASAVSSPPAAPNDPSYAFEGSSWPYTLTSMEQAWAVARVTSPIIVAVVDTGVNAADPDLGGVVLPGYNATDGSTDTADSDNHGTAVAATIAAHRNNGIGSAGICDSCLILPVKVIDKRGKVYANYTAAGIVWAADHGARVINVSIIGPSYSALGDAVAYAEAKGAIVVAAAGNAALAKPDGCGLNGLCGGYPAAYPGVLSVAASDSSDALYPYSSHGISWVAVAAPGCVNAPQFQTEPGSETLVLDAAGQPIPDGYGRFCGSSAAAPFVAGLAGLLLAGNPALSGTVVQKAIETSTDHVASLDVTYGRVNALSAFKTVGLATLDAPTTSNIPLLRGAARSGQTLSATTGVWLGDLLHFSFRWQRSSANGLIWKTVGSGSHYRLGRGDRGRRLRVQVTATNTAGQQSASSVASARVVG